MLGRAQRAAEDRAPPRDAQHLAHEARAGPPAGTCSRTSRLVAASKAPSVKGSASVGTMRSAGSSTLTARTRVSGRKLASCPGRPPTSTRSVGRADEVGDDEVALPGVGCAEHAVGQERAQPLRRSHGLPRRHTLASAPRWRPLVAHRPLLERARGHARVPGARCAELRGGDTRRWSCVDNGSTDGSVEAVREQHPDVDVVENGRNLGFAGGNNAGIRYAFEHGAQWVVLVNNDAVLAPDAIEHLRAPRDRASRGRHARGQGLLRRAARSHLVRRPALLAGLRLLGAPARLRPTRRARATGARTAPIARPARSWPCRGRWSTRSGLLDDELFAYVEDVDWSLSRRGPPASRCWFVPDALAWHRVSASTGGERASTHALYYGVRNTIAVSERHLPLPPPLARAAPLAHPRRLPLPGVRPLRAPAPVRGRGARRLPRRARGALRRAPALSSSSA